MKRTKRILRTFKIPCDTPPIDFFTDLNTTTSRELSLKSLKAAKNSPAEGDELGKAMCFSCESRAMNDAADDVVDAALQPFERRWQDPLVL